MLDKLQSFYGLSRPPFAKTITAAQLHQHAAHTQAVARLSWCINARAIGLLCGESGAGKTVAARAAVAALDASEQLAREVQLRPGGRGPSHSHRQQDSGYVHVGRGQGARLR